MVWWWWWGGCGISPGSSAGNWEKRLGPASASGSKQSGAIGERKPTAWKQAELSHHGDGGVGVATLTCSSLRKAASGDSFSPAAHFLSQPASSSRMRPRTSGIPSLEIFWLVERGQR